MARKTIDELPVATPEAVATGSLIIADENGLEYRATTAIIGGVHLYFTAEDDETPWIFGRLTSPGRTVEEITVTFVAIPRGGGTTLTKTVKTDSLGNFTYNFATLVRGVTYDITASVAPYLAEVTVKYVAPLSVPITTPVATSTGKVGDTITVEEPNFDGDPISFKYRYLRGPNYIIPGAIDPIYTLTADDDADVITAQVQAVNAGGESIWYSANQIGPVSNKTSVAIDNPVIAGNTTLGGRLELVSPGTATENAVVKSDEWQLDGEKIPSTKAPVKRYLSGAANGSAPTAYPTGNNHFGVSFTGSAYTGSNTYSYSIAANATENDYIVNSTGIAGGNEGPQVYDLYMRHLNTNSAIRIKMYASRYNAGVRQGDEVQMAKVGATAGQEYAALGVTANAVARWTVTADFGEWVAGDYLVFRQQATNISSSGSNNYQWDARAGASYAMLPIGSVQDIQKTLKSFTSKADMSVKSARLKQTLSNGFNEVVLYSNEIVYEAAVTQTAVPANITLPTVVATSDRANVTWQADLGAWSNQPTAYAVQWTDNGVDISGATLMNYKSTTAQEGHDITFYVIAENAIGFSEPATAVARTVQAAATYYNIATGNDLNDGSTELLAKQSLASTESIPSGSTAILAGDFGTRLKLGTGRDYEGLGAGLTSIGSLTTQYAIDHYTDDGSLGRSNVKISKMTINSADRAILARSGSNWVLEDIVIDSAGFGAGVIAENASGIMFYRNNGITMRRCSLLNIKSDGLYLDTVDKVLIEDCLFMPVNTAEGDTIQTRADRTSSSGAPGPHQKGFILSGTFLDMHSKKTASGKGCLVTNMADYVYCHDNRMDGNNFVAGTDEGDSHVFCRNSNRYARMNSYSFGYSIGGYDNQPASYNHQLYDNDWYDINRALTFSGISVTGYSGVKSGRVDIVAHDETIVKCASGIRIDRPTSGMFRGFVFHNVTRPVDRVLTTLPPGGEIQAFISDSHYTYNGSILVPPTVTTRAVITGDRTVGSELTGPNSVFDTTAVLTAFPGAVITRSYQWRRHKPQVQWAGWSEHLGWKCEWIAGATSASYTITDDDQGCLISRVDRIHLSFTEASVAKVVTALSYDASYATSTPIPRSGDLAVPLPVIPSTGTVSFAAAEGAVALNLPALITGETRTLLNPSRAHEVYTSNLLTVDSNGDILKGAGTFTLGQVFGMKLRQKRGIDTIDHVINFTVVA
ncbi:putative polysaccharidase [Rhizobium phage P9VFCI]|uniref:Putative polysaccharidase n=1 Tax=Rhizobium phage P9VFCI TaxID=2763531 RepID=A0A7G7WX35_9CAUD|nr:putative polysaccharidase [Rhizobium phage P9VFCI]QNH71779.1 putative polysaccharidase [Rhizobium phage P9VFCI]